MNTHPLQQHTQLGPRGYKLAAIAALALLAGVTACSSDGNSSSTTSRNGSAVAAVPPVIVDVTDIDGTTVEVPVGGTIDIQVPEATVAQWSADISDTTVAHFVPGRTDGSATFNPGLVGDKAGTTSVTLSDTSSATTVSFSVQVKED